MGRYDRIRSALAEALRIGIPAIALQEETHIVDQDRIDAGRVCCCLHGRVVIALSRRF
jgi:hypothetical protein